MKDEITELQVAAILKALDDALEKGPWDTSNFLRVIGKSLREIRDNLANQISFNEENARAKQPERKSLRSGHKEIYVALYSSEGNNLQSWERIIANLQRQMVSRPIYADEENAMFLIRSKENRVNEAYVAISINEDDILTMSPEKIPLDRFGKQLMSIKDRSLNLENINRFVHLGQVYKYVKGRLIKDIP